MKTWIVALLALMLVACAGALTAPTQPPRGLLHDQLFDGPSTYISADEVFALNDEMRRFLRVDIADALVAKGTRQGLFDALYSQGQLKLEYDSLVTKNAAQAFATRSGNCLSLVIMTAAFAKELGVPVRFQRAASGEIWSRSGNVQYFIGHVNLTLGVKSADAMFGRASTDQMTIDFLPPAETRGMSSRVVDEKTIVAMYMNNRAAESFALGNMTDAYWWARGAILQNAQFVSSYNTLGVVYQRTGHLPEAEAVLAYALQREPDNTRVISNLASVLAAEGRAQESLALSAKLDQLEPDPPFRYFSLGMAALQKGDYREAHDQFAREVARAPYNGEFHYWLAVADVGLGETESARWELARALEYSSTRQDHDLYAAKLARIRQASSAVNRTP
jgi:Flp pilus assembly protein TadD